MNHSFVCDSKLEFGVNALFGAAMTGWNVYEQLKEKCNLEQLLSFLRIHRNESPQISISGNKETLVANVRDAVSEGWITVQQVHDFLKESEENGDQHFFLFRRVPNTVQMDISGTTIAEKLFGVGWATQFPLRIIPDGKFEWSDFRIDSHGWTGKLYGLNERRELVKQGFTSEDGHPLQAKALNGQYFETFVYRVEKTTEVCLVRFEGENLEIRVPRSTSRPKIKQCAEAVWAELNRAGIAKNNFTPLDFGMARRKFVAKELVRLAEIEKVQQTVEEDAEAEAKLEELAKRKIRINDMRFQDSNGGSVDFKPPNEVEGFSQETRRAMNEVYSNAPCLDLVVFWQPVEGVLKEELRTQFISQDGFENEFVIRSKTSQMAVDYVTKNLFAACQ